VQLASVLGVEAVEVMTNERTSTVRRVMWSLNSAPQSKITFDLCACQLDNKIKIEVILEIL